MVLFVEVVEADIFGCWVVMIIRSVILCSGSTCHVVIDNGPAREL